MVVSVLGKVLGLSSRWQATRATKRVQVAVRRKVYEHAMRLPLHRVYQLKSGGASSLLREDAGGVGELIFSMIYNPWQAVVQFVGGLVVLAWVDWRLLLGACLLVPGVYYSDLIWNRRIRPLFRDVRKERQEIDSQTTEVFGGMRVVRAFGRQKSESARFMGENHFMVRLELHVWWLSRLIELLWEFLLPMASVALLLYGGMQVIDGRLSLGDLMMFLVYLAMLLEPMAVLATSVTQFQNNLSGFDRVLDLLAEPREMADCPGTRAVVKSAVSGRIRLQDVGFTYPGTSRLVLHDIDLEVEPGETIALVGRSGSGKTTLCNLIARFYDPTHGAIALDGVNLREVRVESYRRLLGIVEQDVFLFDGTIAQNIAYGDRWSTRARIAQAAHRGQRRGIHRAAPRRLRHADRRAWSPSERRSAAAAGHRARRARRPEDLHPRRGDQQPRHRERAVDPAESRPGASRPHFVCDRPPPEYDSPRRPDLGARRRHDHRSRQPPRADGRRRHLPRHGRIAADRTRRCRGLIPRSDAGHALAVRSVAEKRAHKLRGPQNAVTASQPYGHWTYV